MSERHDHFSEPESQQRNNTTMVEKKLFCAECNLSFRSMNWLIRHDLQCHPRSYDFNTSQGDKLSKCSYCPAAFTTNWNKNKHEERCRLKVHPLPQLNSEKPLLEKKKVLKVSRENAPIKKEVLVAHPLSQPYGKKTPSKKKVRRSKSKTCVKSSQQYIISNPKSNTTTEVKITPGGVPFEYANPLHCSFCPKLLLSSTGKVAHEKMHTGEMPYECKFCKTSFSLQCHLDTHEKKCSELVDEHWCQFCDFHSKLFSTVKYHCRKVHRVLELNESEFFLKEEDSSDGTLYSDSIRYEEFSDEEVPSRIENIPIAIKNEPAYYWTQSFVMEDDDEDED